jgi:hypothetical protein
MSRLLSDLVSIFDQLAAGRESAAPAAAVSTPPPDSAVQAGESPAAQAVGAEAAGAEAGEEPAAQA